MTPRFWRLLCLLLFLCLIKATHAFGIGIIAGNSMTPSLRDGRVVVYTSLAPVRPGSVVLAWADGELLCHRVQYANHHGWVIAGDTGSNFALVGGEQIEGVVVWPRV